MSLLAHRLMRLIETHAEELAETLEAKIVELRTLRDIRRVSSEEMKGWLPGFTGI